MQNKHTLIYFLGRGIPGLLSFVAVTVYTRFVDPSEYGKYALVAATVALMNMILYQWIRLSLLRFLPKSTSIEEQGRLFSAVALGFLISCFISSVLLLVYCLIDQPGEIIIRIYILGLTLLFMEAFFELNLEFFRSSLKPVKYSFAFLTKSIVSLTAGSIFVWYHQGAVGIIQGILIADLTALLVFFTPFSKKLFFSFKYFDVSFYKKLIIYGLPLTASFAMSFIINSSDRYFINYFLNPAATGVYSVAYDFSNNSLSVIMNSINLASFPLAVRALEKGGVQVAREQLNKNIELLLIIAVPASLGLATLAERIASVFMGHAYVTETAKIIPFISIGGLIIGFKSYYLDLAFQLGNKTYLQIWSVGTAAVINVVLNIIWIPTIGIKGAIYSTLISYIVAVVLSYVLSKRCFDMPLPGLKILKILLSATVMSVFILYSKDLFRSGSIGLVFIIALSVLIYAISLTLFGVLKLSFLSSLFGKKRS